MNQIDKIAKALIKAENEIKSAKNMQVITQISVEMIQERVRDRGKGVANRGGNEHNLAPLKPSTIKARSRKKLHPKTSPARSNLTETGQMLDALRAKGIRKGVGRITINPKRRGTTITNDEVSFFVSGKRPFMDLSKSELARLTKITAEKTTKLYKKFLKNIN